MNDNEQRYWLHEGGNAYTLVVEQGDIGMVQTFWPSRLTSTPRRFGDEWTFDDWKHYAATGDVEQLTEQEFRQYARREGPAVEIFDRYEEYTRPSDSGT